MAQRAVGVGLEHRDLDPEPAEDRSRVRGVDPARDGEHVADHVGVDAAHGEPGVRDLHDLRVADVPEDPVVEHPLDLLEPDRGDGVGAAEHAVERALGGVQAA